MFGDFIRAFCIEFFEFSLKFLKIFAKNGEKIVIENGEIKKKCCKKIILDAILLE